jgi:hypothetical protein
MALGLLSCSLLAACGGSGGASAAASADWHGSVTQFINTSGPLALPQREPAGLQTVQALTLEGQPAATFYSPREPLVTVCSGNVEKCRTALGTSKEIRAGLAGDLMYVVAVGQSEDPAKQAALSSAAGVFWNDVAIAATTPAWVTTPPLIHGDASTSFAPKDGRKRESRRKSLDYLKLSL